MNDQTDLLTIEADKWADPLTAPMDLVAPVEALPAVAEPTAEQPPAVISEGPSALLNAIVQLAKDPAVDVTKLDAILKMQERMTERQAQVEFNEGLARLPFMYVKKNGTVNLEGKDGKNKGQSYKFAKWEDMARLIEPYLTGEGFRLTFDSVQRQADGGGLVVTGHLRHRAGHSISASMPLPLDTGFGRNNLQAGGSTLSYCKRYVAEMLLPIIREGEDDDGVLAGVRFITEEQVGELAALGKEAGVFEGTFVERMASSTTGEPVRSYNEIETKDYTRIANTLRIMAEKKKKAKGSGNDGEGAP